jgi:hypothetical protein
VIATARAAVGIAMYGASNASAGMLLVVASSIANAAPIDWPQTTTGEWRAASASNA